jgi:hypothetical protein
VLAVSVEVALALVSVACVLAAFVLAVALCRTAADPTKPVGDALQHPIDRMGDEIDEIEFVLPVHGWRT